LLIDHAVRQPHLIPGFWRGVNINHNVIYVESFIDELAHLTGQDPLEFRRKIMGKYPKNLAVLNAVAERAGWGKPLPPGHGLGLAQCTAFGSHIAACSEVSVKDGRVKVHKIVAATDSGHAVNPQQIEAQVEGSFAYGLSAAFYQEITVKDGKVEQENFDSYQPIRIDEMPDVESLIMPSGGFWGGVGEPTIAVGAPSVLNAIFAATGKRIRNLPIKNNDLRTA
jgi:isoquinoline 1-oxidoreductase beta subunit